MAGGDPAGGSAGLAELIERCGEELYFDLHHYAGGLNLVQALEYGSGYSPRQILWLVSQLPIESATVAALRGGPQFRGWGLDRYLSAQQVDAIQHNTYITLATSGATKKKPKAPEPVWRPQKEEKKKVNSFAAMAGAFFQAAKSKNKPKE